MFNIVFISKVFIAFCWIDWIGISDSLKMKNETIQMIIIVNEVTIKQQNEWLIFSH